MPRKPVVPAPIVVQQNFAATSLTFEGAHASLSVSASSAVELREILHLCMGFKAARDLLEVEFVSSTKKHKPKRR